VIQVAIEAICAAIVVIWLAKRTIQARLGVI
jgi:hypothetical protein